MEKHTRVEDKKKTCVVFGCVVACWVFAFLLCVRWLLCVININFCDERKKEIKKKKKKSNERRKRKKRRCCLVVSFPAKNSQRISRGQFRVRLR